MDFKGIEYQQAANFLPVFQVRFDIDRLWDKGKVLGLFDLLLLSGVLVELRFGICPL